MEIIQGDIPLTKIAAVNSGKIIGKCSYNYNKITDDRLSFHEGHEELIKQLRLAGAEIIIVEFINPSNVYKTDSLITTVPTVNQLKVLDNCIAENLDADYIIYDSDDFKTNFSAETIKLVDERVVSEDYKNKLSIPDHIDYHFRTNLTFVTERHLPNMIVARSYENGPDIFALKHYMNKYLSCNMLITSPVMVDGENFPLSSTTNDLHDDTKTFLNYFYTISKDDIINNPVEIKTNIEQYAINLGHHVENFTIIDDPVFIGAGKIFISTYFHGAYNTTIPANRWL